jgi:8-hydroxy-5-deazaflavin:NADPH oxidoreductase
MKKIAVFGSGVVAQIVGERLAGLGHPVMIGTRNVAETMARTDNDMFGRPAFKVWAGNNPQIQVGTFAEAAAFGELLVNATNGGGSLPALKLAGEKNLAGKVLIDIANPLDFSKGFPPSLTVCNTDSLAEQLQNAFPDLRVVKSLNTMNAFVMVNPGMVPGDHNVFLSGNDEAAKADVKGILGSFGWKPGSMIDLGDITSARGTEMLLPIWVRLYGSLKHGNFNFHVAGVS